jgi:DNA-binding NarL/FixJ family response regulator
MDKVKCVIVCVDDEPIILQMLQFQLKKRFDIDGVIMEFFQDHNEVFSFIDEVLDESIELAIYIVDFQMPGINGVELIKRIQAQSPSSKFIMLSGQANNLIVNQLQNERSLEAFMLKPWEERELMDSIALILKKYNMI